MTARTPPEELYLRTVDEAARETKRIALLDAAAQCFAERGYNATRTADICSAAGMSSGNLFHYFPPSTPCCWQSWSVTAPKPQLP